MIKTRTIGFVAAALLTALATAVVCFGEAVALVSARPAALTAVSRPTALLEDAKPWLTPAPSSAPSLRGKVVVVNFWTYSCINSLRALPYLRAWQERYGDKGLVIVGVHAPEFEFEHDPAKVRLAVEQLGVHYPVLQDNRYSVWRDFGNEGWPGFYFVDAKGRVRDYRVGEGDYANSERLIRQLLEETGRDLSEVPMSPVASAGIEAQADWRDLRSPEAYLGYAKAASFRSPGGIRHDVRSRYEPAKSLSLNSWDLAGDWTVGQEFATLEGSAGSLSFRFHARDAHLVLGGAPDGEPVRFRVSIDGAPPGASHGVDVDPEGWGEIKEDRLYQLVRQPDAIRDRTLTIAFSRPGVRAYVFTFG